MTQGGHGCQAAPNVLAPETIQRAENDKARAVVPLGLGSGSPLRAQCL
jgi:hypothetical protein